MKTLCCEICGEQLAKFDPEKMKAPINGGMFSPLREGYPMPWPQPAAQIDWENLKCPFCKYRVANNPDRVQTTEGMHIIAPPAKPKRRQTRKSSNAGSSKKKKSAA